MELQTHGKLWAILHLRCPRCHHGRVYSGVLAMNRECPVCRLVFEREPGYFTGATFFSFVLGAALAAVWAIVLFLSFPDLSDFWAHTIALLLMLPFLPLIMRYARVLWMTMDRSIDISR